MPLSSGPCKWQMSTSNVKDDAYTTKMMGNCFYKSRVNNKKTFLTEEF